MVSKMLTEKEKREDRADGIFESICLGIIYFFFGAFVLFCTSVLAYSFVSFFKGI